MSLKNFLFGQGNSNLKNQVYRQLLQNHDPKTFGTFYQNSFVNPVMQMLQQQLIPQIKQQFMGGNQWGNSGLNQALSQAIQQAAQTLQNGLMNQYNTQQKLSLGALQSLGANEPGLVPTMINNGMGSLMNMVLGALPSLLGRSMRSPMGQNLSYNPSPLREHALNFYSGSEY